MAIAGLAISALILAAEKRSGKPSELGDLERNSGKKLGLDTPPADAAVMDEDTPVLPGGLAFGMAFHAAAHGAAGPAIGIKPPVWRETPGSIGQPAMIHALFGLCTAYVARHATDRQCASVIQPPAVAT